MYGIRLAYKQSPHYMRLSHSTCLERRGPRADLSYADFCCLLNNVEIPLYPTMIKACINMLVAIHVCEYLQHFYCNFKIRINIFFQSKRVKISVILSILQEMREYLAIN